MTTIAKTVDASIESLDFSKANGLIPAIVQDAVTGEVLMLGFMNVDACRLTLSTGYVTFFSRTRNQLWTKGETSGNRLRLVSAVTDCDRDTLLLHVEVEGAGLVCHEGTRSCFTMIMDSRGLESSVEIRENDQPNSVNPAKMQMSEVEK